MSEYPAQIDYLEAHIKSIEKQLAELREKLRWIPVSERLPNQKGYYELRYETDPSDHVCCIYSWDGEFFTDDCDSVMKKPKYWREIPELGDGK